MKIIWNIILFIIDLVFKFPKDNRHEKRIEEDKELADAIKRGDGKTIGKIRNHRKFYSLLIILLFFTGCTSSYKDIPLSSGTIPYQLPPGIYIDAKKKVHNEEKPRWSLSEEDLFDSTRNLDKKGKMSIDKTHFYIFFGGLFIFCCMIMLNIYRK